MNAWKKEHSQRETAQLSNEMHYMPNYGRADLDLDDVIANTFFYVKNERTTKMAIPFSKLRNTARGTVMLDFNRKNLSSQHTSSE